MAGYLNKVTLIGNLGKDPEVRHMQDGRKVVSFSLATTEFWRDKITNERKDKTEWHQIVIFNERVGDIASQYLHKGSKIYLEGQLQTRKWSDNTGQDRYTTEVVLQRFRGELMMMDSRSNAEAEAFEPSEQPPGMPPASDSSASSGNGIDDEIPF